MDEEIKTPEISGENDHELDDILAGYQNAPVNNTGLSGLFDTPASPASPNPSDGGGPKPLPFLSHDPSQAPKQEYYTRGAKKGQPKPPKKGQAPPLNQAGQLSIQATTFITGAIFVTMIDMIIPLFMVGIFNFISSKKKGASFKPLDYEKVQMSTKQKSDLATVADAVVRELKLSGSPSFLFFLGLAGVYFMNFILQKSLHESQLLKEAKNEKDNNRTT